MRKIWICIAAAISSILFSSEIDSGNFFQKIFMEATSQSKNSHGHNEKFVQALYETFQYRRPASEDLDLTFASRERQLDLNVFYAEFHGFLGRLSSTKHEVQCVISESKYENLEAKDRRFCIISIPWKKEGDV